MISRPAAFSSRALLVTAMVGAALAIPALRVTGPYLAMMTIALAFIVEHGTIEWRDVTGGANGLMVFESPTLLGRTLAEAGEKCTLVIPACCGIVTAGGFPLENFAYLDAVKNILTVQSRDAGLFLLGFQPADSQVNERLP